MNKYKSDIRITSHLLLMNACSNLFALSIDSFNNIEVLELHKSFFEKMLLTLISYRRLIMYT